MVLIPVIVLWIETDFSHKLSVISQILSISSNKYKGIQSKLAMSVAMAFLLQLQN